MINETHTITIIKNALYIPVAYVGISHDAITALTILLLIDTFVGVLAAHAVGNRIKSSILAGGLLSKLVLLLIPFSIALAGKVVGYDLNGLVGASISVLALAEVYSIIGNIIQIRTKQEVDEQDAMHLALMWIRGVMEKMLDKRTGK